MRPGSGSRAILSSVYPAVAVANDVLGERLRAPVGERVRGDHHPRRRRSGSAPEEAPQRQRRPPGRRCPRARRRRGRSPARRGRCARSRPSRACRRPKASLRVGLAAGHDRRDEPLDARGHRRVAGEAVGLADETVLRLHLAPLRTRARGSPSARAGAAAGSGSVAVPDPAPRARAGSSLHVDAVVGEEAAVDVEHLPVHVGRAGRGEEADHRADLVRVGEPAGGDPLQHVCAGRACPRRSPR